MYISCKKYKNYILATKVDYTLDYDFFTKAKIIYKCKVTKEKNKLSTLKLSNNLIRSRQKIFDYALSNYFNYFVTLTISPKYNRSDYNSVFRLVSRQLREVRSDIKNANEFKNGNEVGLEYLFVPELHKDGINYHFHGLIQANLSNHIYINKNGFYSIDFFDKIGFNSVEKIKNQDSVSVYITKYITKSNNIPKGQRSYFVSKGLNLPDKKIIRHDLNLDYQFQNLYCKKSKLPIDLWETLN